jgi:cysteine desulfurase / selenocysteine lyase
MKYLEEMDPFLYGGDMISRVRKESSTFKPAPDKFEAGTPNIAGVIGLGKAVEYLESIGMDAIADHEQHLIEYLRSEMEKVPGVVLYGPRNPHQRGGILSFNYADVHSHDVGSLLDQEGVAVRTGFHCAQPLMRKFGVPGTVRASVYLYNTLEEMDALVRSLDTVRKVFGV